MIDKFSANYNVLQPDAGKPFTALQIPAQFFSYIFHPLFIPALATWYLAFVHQYYFTGMSPQQKLMILLPVLTNSIFFPAFAVLLLKPLGFIKSIFLRTQKERIIPYVIANFFYFWLYLVCKNNTSVPPVLTAFIFGVFLSSSAGLLANSYFKISMHALGMGSLLGLILIIIFSGFSYSVFLSAIVIFLIAGIVCTSRLIVSDHTSFDIYAGLFIGIVFQFIAAAFIG